jgi:hypothetical protein
MQHRHHRGYQRATSPGLTIHKHTARPLAYLAVIEIANGAGLLITARRAFAMVETGLHTASARLPVEGELPSLGGATGRLNSPPLIAVDLLMKITRISCMSGCRAVG